MNATIKAQLVADMTEMQTAGVSRMYSSVQSCLDSNNLERAAKYLYGILDRRYNDVVLALS